MLEISTPVPDSDSNSVAANRSKTNAQHGSSGSQHALVNSWMSGVNANAFLHHDSRPPSPPPSSLRARPYEHLKQVEEEEDARGRKRRRIMASGRASNSDLLSDRPILTPHPPSRRRSQSPVRKLQSLLQGAIPAVVCQQVNEAQPPQYAIELIQRFVAATEEGFIPEQLKDNLRASAPSEFFGISDKCFATSDASSAQLKYLWAGIKEIYHAAEKCRRFSKDENAWVQVVWLVLLLAKQHLGLDLIEVNSVQTQVIDPKYLPTTAKSATSSASNSSNPFQKKTDLTLCIDPDRANSAELCLMVPYDGLSQMADAYTSRLAMACAIEVKMDGGNHEEATIQYGIWAAAGLAKRRELLCGADLPLPLLGWTIVGHNWELYVSWKLENGKVVNCGPWRKLSAVTDTYEGIFKLLRLVSRIGKYIQDDYWPLYSESIHEVWAEDKDD